MARPEPTSVRDMTDGAFAEFVEQMRIAVAEEAYLWELPAGSKDLVAPEQWRVHGPWRQEDCAAAVTVWLDAGLAFLLRRWPDEQPLDTRAARFYLLSPEAWVSQIDGSTNVAVVATDTGDAKPWNEWRARLSALRSG